MLLVQKMVLPNNVSVSLTVENNQPYHLQGPNGAGKSLLLKSLAYLLPTTFERFEYQGKDVGSLEPELYRRDVLYVPSVPFLWMEGTVEDFLKIPLRFKVYENFTPTFDVTSVLEKWDLKGKALSQLSSGEKQLLSIARALMLNPKVLLLDEVTSHLSQERSRDVELLLANWLISQDRSMIWVSHQPLSTIRAQSIDFHDLKR